MAAFAKFDGEFSSGSLVRLTASAGRGFSLAAGCGRSAGLNLRVRSRMLFRSNFCVPLIAAALLAAAPAAAQQQQPAQRAPTPRPAPQHSAQAPQQQQQAAPPQAAQVPQRTTASYGDWVVRCDLLAGPPPQKNCDMEQMAQVQGQANPISRVAIPLPAKAQPPKLIVQLPVNATFAGGVKIALDAKDAGVTAPFTRCVPAGCLAEIELKDPELKRFRAANTAEGSMQYKDAGERDVKIPLSLKGFAQAYDALLKQ